MRNDNIYVMIADDDKVMGFKCFRITLQIKKIWNRKYQGKIWKRKESELFVVLMG